MCIRDSSEPPPVKARFHHVQITASLVHHVLPELAELGRVHFLAVEGATADVKARVANRDDRDEMFGLHIGRGVVLIVIVFVVVVDGQVLL